MAITYTNNFYTYIITPLDKIIQDEFEGVQITYDVPSGDEYFSVVPTSDELLGLRGSGQVREYSVQITYTYKQGAEYQKDVQLQHLANVAERFKRLMWNNTDTSNWFDGRVDSISYEQDDDAKENFKTVIECSFSREEVI